MEIGSEMLTEPGIGGLDHFAFKSCAESGGGEDVPELILGAVTLNWSILTVPGTRSRVVGGGACKTDESDEVAFPTKPNVPAPAG